MYQSVVQAEGVCNEVIKLYQVFPALGYLIAVSSVSAYSAGYLLFVEALFECPVLFYVLSFKNGFHLLFCKALIRMLSHVAQHEDADGTVGCRRQVGKEDYVYAAEGDKEQDDVPYRDKVVRAHLMKAEHHHAENASPEEDQEKPPVEKDINVFQQGRMKAADKSQSSGYKQADVYEE